ncbi:MAG TPA: hypothetical protein VLS28_01705, partial [Candidatus Sulfomarinibacteraceae bacterium]|nr:hypothetical protein [Candidatus Sulfomarinibacteraceae bacterium]
ETPADETPADETPADETPADETPADETPADETPADETPADETPAAIPNTNDQPQVTDEDSTDEGSADRGSSNQASPVEPAGPQTTIVESTPPTQDVLAEIAFGPGFELPETDTVQEIETNGGTSSLLAILIGLGAIAALAVLIAPSRRRTPDATE